MKRRCHLQSVFNRRPKGEPRPMPQQQVMPSHSNVAGIFFALAAIVSIDTSTYEQGEPDRNIVLTLVGPVRHVFTDKRADEFYLWYLTLTGQNRVQTLEVPGAPPTMRSL